MATATAQARNKGKRPDVEAELADHYHVGFTYHAGVATSEFDIDKSLANQARFEAIDEPTVALYQEGVKRGDAFPAVIAVRSGRSANAKLVIIDGNHRLVAHDREGAPIDVYEVDRTTKAPTIVLMTYSFNTRHGRPTSETERVHQALYLMDNGAPLESAAATVNVPARIVRKAQAKKLADRRADEVGADRREWEALTASVRSRLLNIGTDEGFAGAIHLAYAARLGAEDVFELVTTLNQSKSAAKHKAILKAATEQWSDEIQENGAGALGSNSSRSAMTPKRRVNMLLGQVVALPDDDNATAEAWAPAERTDAAVRLMNASDRLRKLALKLDAKVT